MAITNDKAADDTVLWATSLVSQSTKEGVVELRWGNRKMQMSVAEARQHAMQVLEVAEAAETDAFLVAFFQQLDNSFEGALRMLVKFREFREAREASRHH